jgi:hypothetical protein
MNRADLIERACLHGDWTLVCDDSDRPIVVVCGRCGADRDIKVAWTYADVHRQEEGERE